MAKSPDAFRTISEVSDWLDTPAHVLRFWESKFSQIKPVKRAGGRRYYRPQDMALLGGIKTLLHEQGMTIKGAQKLLREKGVKHVASLGPQPGETDDQAIERKAIDVTPAEEQTPQVETHVAPQIAPSPDPEPEDDDDPWPADPRDPTPIEEMAFQVDTPPEPVVSETAEVEEPETPAPSIPQRSIPALPDAAAAQARPGLLAIVTEADVEQTRKNISKILPLASKLSDVHRRMAAR